jgi:hypothetical protein
MCWELRRINFLFFVRPDGRTARIWVLRVPGKASQIHFALRYTLSYAGYVSMDELTTKSDFLDIPIHPK